jgi:hypothetical protein
MSWTHGMLCAFMRVCNVYYVIRVYIWLVCTTVCCVIHVLYDKYSYVIQVYT